MEPLKQYRPDLDSQVRIIIGDFHGEYPLPQGRGFALWDGFRVSEILVRVRGSNTANIDPELTDMFKKFVESLKADNYNGVWNCAQLEDPYTTLYDVTFSNRAEVFEYFEAWGPHVREAILEAGGDDDFFDYMPNFVDMYEQLAELIGKTDEAKQLIQQAINDSDHDADLIADAFGPAYSKQ